MTRVTYTEIKLSVTFIFYLFFARLPPTFYFVHILADTRGLRRAFLSLHIISFRNIARFW